MDRRKTGPTCTSQSQKTRNLSLAVDKICAQSFNGLNSQEMRLRFKYANEVSDIQTANQ
jgi:hypothetical protein